MSLLLTSIARSYVKRGWRVYSNQLDGFDKMPPSWTGPKPEILAVKRKDSVAVCHETGATLNYPNITDKWDTILKHNDVTLVIAVRDEDHLERVKSLARARGVDLTVRIMKKARRRQHTKNVGANWSSSRFDHVMIVSVAVVLVAFLILFVPGIIKKFRPKAFYQPKDRERQEYMQQIEQSGSEEEKLDKARKGRELQKELEAFQKENGED